MKKAVVIGGGLAGCEAAMMIARYGPDVDLYEMKPKRFSPAHKSDRLAELVCSNSLGADGEQTAQGILKHEMKELQSVVLEAAEKARVPAGKALSVDRAIFSESITRRISEEKRIRIVREECTAIP